MRIFVTGIPHSGTTLTVRLLAEAMDLDLGDINHPGGFQGSEWLPLKKLVDANEGQELSVERLDRLPQPTPKIFKLAAVPATVQNYHKFIQAFAVSHVVFTWRDPETWISSIRVQGVHRHTSDDELRRVYEQHKDALGDLVNKIYFGCSHVQVLSLDYPRMAYDIEHWIDQMVPLVQDRERLMLAHRLITDESLVNRNLRR